MYDQIKNLLDSENKEESYLKIIAILAGFIIGAGLALIFL